MAEYPDRILINRDILPLSQNQVYRRRAQGGMYMTEKGKSFKSIIGWEAKNEMLGYKPFEGPVSVFIDLFFSDNRKRDIDGPIKLILDALNGIIYKDDSQITRLTIHKRKAKEPAITILIEPSVERRSN